MTTRDPTPPPDGPLPEIPYPGGVYRPAPIDTSAVPLPAGLQHLVERLARHNHDVWARGRIQAGWRWGPARDDPKRLHPDLKPYEDLEESEKQFDRNAAVETLRAILALGFEIGGADEGK